MIEKHIIQVFICVFLYFMYVCLCLLIFVHHMKVWLFRSQMGSNPLKLGLQAVLSCHVCVGNQTVFLWKSSQRAKELSNLSSPIPFFFISLVFKSYSRESGVLLGLWTEHEGEMSVPCPPPGLYKFALFLVISKDTFNALLHQS